MISSLSRLTSEMKIIVLDASVLINILGSGSPKALLAALRREVVVPVLREVNRDPVEQRSSDVAIASLIESGLLRMESLDDLAANVFWSLVGAPSPDDLGDGEAAAIAYAVSTGAVSAIDDRKARRVAAANWPNQTLLHSIELFLASDVVQLFPPSDLADLVYGALSNARMRVPVEHRKAIVALIGADRASLCSSLGFRSSFED